MLENALLFNSRGKQLVAIEHLPTKEKEVEITQQGVVIVVGGPQTRVGSHRLFVQLARALAETGISVFRFDYTGAGDSEGIVTEFTEIQADIDAAITCFTRRNPQLTNISLWGLCDAASAILLYLSQSPKHQPLISQLILVNPWVRQAHTQAETYLKSYYIKRLLSRPFWLKLLSGKVSSSAALSDIKAFNQQSKKQNTKNTVSFVEQMRFGLSNFAGKSTVILSDNDLTADEFNLLIKKDRNWRTLFSKNNDIQLSVVKQADHTFSKPQNKQTFIDITKQLFID